MDVKENSLFDFSEDVLLWRQLQENAESGKFGSFVKNVPKCLSGETKCQLLEEDCLTDVRCLFHLLDEFEAVREFLQNVQFYVPENPVLRQLLILNDHRLDFLYGWWHRAFPYLKSHLKDWNDDEVLSFWEMLVDNKRQKDILLKGCELKLFSLVREISSDYRYKNEIFWKKESEILLSPHVVNFIFENARESGVKNFIYWFCRFAHDQFKLGFFFYFYTIEKLKDKIEQLFEQKGKKDEHVGYLLREFYQYS